MNILDEKGRCQKCMKDAQSEHMECFMCKYRYHVIECEGEDPMVQKSFLNSQWPTISRKWPCIVFMCHNCREDSKTKEDHIMSQRVRLLEESASKTSKQLDVITELLTEKQLVLPTPGKSFADVASKKEDAPSLIIVDKSEEEPSESERKSRMEELKQVAIQSKASIKRAFTNKSGKTVVLCNNEKSKEIMLPHVNKLFPASKVNTPEPKLPTISVPFIDGKYGKEELLAAMRNQNEGNGINFDDSNTQVIFTSPMRDQKNEGLYQAVIRVSDDIRAKIKANGNRIFIGSSSCPVYDRFYVKRCNNCQSYHHFHKDCRKPQVCAHCAEHHDTRKCNKEDGNYKCINCAIGGFKDTSHKASSIDCPAYIAEQDKLKKSIFYYSKNS